MGTTGRWAGMREEFSGRAGRVRLALLIAAGSAAVAALVGIILVERPHRSPNVQAVFLVAQLLGCAFAASLRPHPAKWWLASAFGFGMLSTLVRLL